MRGQGCLFIVFSGAITYDNIDVVLLVVFVQLVQFLVRVYCCPEFGGVLTI